MAYTVRWLGQGGFELTDGRVSILIDPYLSDLVEKLEGLKRLVPPPIPPSEAHSDLYLITHDHPDHLDTDTITAMRKDGVHFGAPGSCRGKLLELGLREEDISLLDRGGKLSCGSFDIEAVYAKHTVDSIGLVIGCEGISAYFTGDTELDEKLGLGVECDALFVCINGRWGNMGIEDALLLAKRVGAKLAVPHHYGMFAENTADPEPFIQGVNQSGGLGFEMRHGQAFHLNDLVNQARHKSARLSGRARLSGTA
jgi:L-ascorbate 6-phosphate lactonase